MNAPEEPKFKIFEDGVPVPDNTALISVERTGTVVDAISLYEPDAPLDQRYWRIMLAKDGSLTLQSWNDAQSAYEEIRIGRVGIKVKLSD